MAKITKTVMERLADRHLAEHLAAVPMLESDAIDALPGSIRFLELSVRATNALVYARIYDIDTLTSFSAAELKAIPQCARKSVNEIEHTLYRIGRCLRGDEHLIPAPRPPPAVEGPFRSDRALIVNASHESLAVCDSEEIARELVTLLNRSAGTRLMGGRLRLLTSP